MSQVATSPAGEPLLNVAAAALKPRLRGVIHQYAFFCSLAAGAALVAFAPTGDARIAMAIYAASVAALFGTSALYHRITWSAPARRRMRRLDHAMIFVLIAGSYTPFAVLALDGTYSKVVLMGVWGGALAGIVQQLIWIDAPKWLSAAIYVGLGWFSLVAMPGLYDALGGVAIGLLAFGGVLYTVGAVIYARRRPDPAPHIFGYHELFHALTVLAALVQLAAIAFYVLPQAT
jgi:hemolysin III